METVTIAVDAGPGAPREPLRPIWRYVGYDEPNYTYTDLGRELLDKLAGMADGPLFVRCHFLLCSGDGAPSLKWGSTNVFSRDERGRPRYDWTVVDRIFDTWVDRGLLPFVEIGFTPEAMTSAPEGTPYRSSSLGSGWSYPPVDPEEWAQLVGRLAEHCVERYGLREVVRWRWELWNEPDIGYFTGTVEQYCALYDYTEHAIHSRYPMLLTGGPSTTNPGSAKAAAFLDAFLEHCTAGTNAVSGARGTRLDFVTFHAKGAHLTREPGAPKQTPTIATLVAHVQSGLDILARYPDLADREVVVSECDPDGWAAGTRYDNPNLEYRNSEYYASYLAATMLALLPLVGAASGEAPRSPVRPRVDGALTWAFEFEGRELFEGMRSLSTNGIDKPVLNAFRLFERLAPMSLPVEVEARDADPAAFVGALATRREDGALAVLIVAHHDDWDVRGETRVRLRFNGLAAAAYTTGIRRIDSARSNAYAEWVAMGRPTSADDEGMDRLREAARLVAEPGALDVTGATLTGAAPTAATGTATVRTDAAAAVELVVENRSVTLVELLPVPRVSPHAR
jgi:xylan 1,4-beta-xylosidase